MNKINIIPLVFATILVFVIGGCASSTHHAYPALNKSEKYYDYIQPTFSAYLSTTKDWLTKNRAYITSDREKEITMNMPFELSPPHSTDRAILLVHGLGDSPYSFSDLAVTFKAQGFYVQTILLPGHGSKPQDLMLPRYSDWQTIVDYYANLLKQDYKEVWLGGFSTGGNLVTIHTIEQGGIDGLFLISPGFQSRSPVLERFAPVASLFFDGYTAEEKNIARYTSAPLNGAIAYTESALKLRKLLDTRTVTVPTLIVLSEADSVVDATAVETLFNQRFHNSHNQMIWYGEAKSDKPYIQAMTMRLDKQRISTGSHMSPLFSPSNPYYGQIGERKMCMNSFSEDATSRCENGEEVWYSAWGYEEDGKIYARLTWNPYYTDLDETIHRMTQKVNHLGNQYGQISIDRSTQY